MVRPHTETMSADPAALQRATEALAEERRRSDALAHFARRTSHDLSNFLTVIRTYAELLLADTPPDAPARLDLTEIGDAADATVSYLQRASAFGRAMQPALVPTPLDEVVRATVAQAMAAAPVTSRTPALVLEDTSGAPVLASAGGLAEALLELIANAREASPPGGTVTLRTRTLMLDAPRVDGGVPIAAGAWAIVEVCDEGPGLADAIAATAFDPFVTTKAGVRGAGLGLAIARATAWGAGGQLALVREAGGTVARLYLPLTTES